MSARWTIMLAALAFLNPADAVGATLCLPRVAGPPIQFVYVMRLVDSFQYAKTALDQTNRAAAALAARQVKTQAEFVEAVTDFLVATKDAGPEYQCAASFVAALEKAFGPSVREGMKAGQHYTARLRFFTGSYRINGGSHSMRGEAL